MISLAVKDLYRFSKETSDKAYKSAERLILKEIEEFKAAEAINRMKEQTIQERLNQAANV